MKKLVLILVCIVSLVAIAHPVQASPTVMLNGQLISFDVPPIVKDGRTLVPMTIIFEALGASVTWDSNTNTVTAQNTDTTIKLQIGNTKALRNNQEITLDVSPTIINGRTLVPLGFVGQAFGAKVDWDSSNERVIITGKKAQKNTQSKNYTSPTYELEDIYKICNPAMVSVITFDAKNLPIASGSGFIVDSNGKMVTNYHLIRGAYSAKVKLSNGTELNISKVMNFDRDKDIAVLQIDSSGLPVVKLGDSDKIASGGKVLTMGSPLGNNISNGLISNPSKIINNQKYIQISTPIATGNSGGALLNYQAEVIGVTTMDVYQAQNLNLVIPINIVRPMLNTNKNLSLAELAKDAPKILGIIMCEGFNKTDNTLINPGTCFSPDADSIYAIMKLDKPFKGSIIGNWYYTNSLTIVKSLACTSKGETKEGTNIIWFYITPNGGPFELGHWQFETFIGDAHSTVDFYVSNS